MRWKEITFKNVKNNLLIYFHRQHTSYKSILEKSLDKKTIATYHIGVRYLTP